MWNSIMLVWLSMLVYSAREQADRLDSYSGPCAISSFKESVLFVASEHYRPVLSPPSPPLQLMNAVYHLKMRERKRGGQRERVKETHREIHF